MVSVAVPCVILRFHCTQKQIFFPERERNTEKRRKKKECFSANEMEGVCQGFANKKYSL